MKITLRQLTVFEAVARLGSVSAAAENISLSQSAASLSVQDLERALGVKLFHRHRKKLTLNENGRRLQPQATNILRLAMEIEGNRTNSALSGTIRLATTDSIGTYLLPQICAQFLASYPQVQVKLTVTSEPEIIELVESMVFDLGFIEGVSMRHSLLVEPWVQDDLVVIASPDHWAAKQRIEVAQLKGESWFLLPIGSPTRHAFTQPYAKLLGAATISFECNSPEVIKRAVQAGQGIACLPRLAVADEMYRGTLTELAIKGFQLPRQFNIISRNDIYQGNIHAAFVKHARASAMESAWTQPYKMSARTPTC